MSNINTCLRSLLIDVESVSPFFAVDEANLPGCSCILGLPAVKEYSISLDRCVAIKNPHLVLPIRVTTGTASAKV